MLGAPKKLWHSSKSALIFTFNLNLSLEEKVKASADMFEIMLKLTSLGYAFQPSTLSTEILNYYVKDKTNVVTSTEMRAENLISKIKKYRTTLHAGANEIQWILRIGKPVTPLPKDSRTNRLDTLIVLSFDD